MKTPLDCPPERAPDFECGTAKRPLGRVLVDAGTISEKDLGEALRLQRETHERLGEILVRMGAVSPEELKAVLSVQRELASFEGAARAVSGSQRKRLGELFIGAKRITKKQLDFALDEQRRTGERLGEVFLRHGWITMRELHVLLAIQGKQSFSPPSGLLLGEILVSSDFITRKQLHSALEKQKRSGKRIGEVLTELGHVSLHHITFALKLQRELISAALVAALSLAPYQFPKRDRHRRHIINRVPQEYM